MVIIPALNEGPRIGDVLDGVRREAPDAEVVVIDDGSTDDTAAVARAAGVRVISQTRNTGYGQALQAGFRLAQAEGAEVVVLLDADGQHDAGSIPHLVDVLDRRQTDLVIGSRFLAENGYRMPFERRIGQWLIRALLVMLTGCHFSDPTSGFKAIRGSALAHLTSRLYPRRHADASSIYFLWKAGLRICEEPAVFHPSPPGKLSLHRGLRPLPYVMWQIAHLLRISLAAIPKNPERGRWGR
jgi:hypothetical protein